MDLITGIGIVAAICSTASFAPQAWRIIRTGDTTSLSVRMYALTVTGFSLWTAYGIGRREWPLIAPNAICLALSAFILIMMLLPARRRRQIAAQLDPTAHHAAAASSKAERAKGG